jgi:outer membrane protein assembly factor BamA
MRIQVPFLLVNLLFTVGCHRVVRPNLAAGLSTGAMIEDVQVRVNRNVSTDVIAPMLATKRGGRINPTVVNEDIVRLGSVTGVETVRVSEEPGLNGGQIVIFNIREKP